MSNVYKCITTCTWDGRYWEDGELTSPLPDSIKPPKHFVIVNNVEELESVLDTIDEEDEPETFANLSQKILEIGNTGVGICSGDDIKTKNFKQLQGIAKSNGLPYEGIKTRQELIDLIENHQDKEGI